jgi:hypothetical protein
MITAVFARGWRWLTGWFRAAPKPFALVFFEGDELPHLLPPRTLVVARDGDEFWSAGMICPCGCGRRIELMLLPGVKPRWDVRVDERGLPTLSPSVWAKSGCRSHFWLRGGRIEWCVDEGGGARA